LCGRLLRRRLSDRLRHLVPHSGLAAENGKRSAVNREERSDVAIQSRPARWPGAESARRARRLSVIDCLKAILRERNANSRMRFQRIAKGGDACGRP